jgi:pyruvate formate lyase activating enzyme
MTVAQVMVEIERDVPFYDESGGGVTVSGGEPLLQPDFLIGLLRACKEKDIHTALDTSGHATWETLDRVRKYVDLFLYDLKLMDDVRHRKFTGVSNDLIVRNLRMLSQRGHDVVLRVPVVPGINDDEENIRQMAAFASALPHLSRVDLLPYHPIGSEKYEQLGRVYRLPETPRPSEARMAEIAQALRASGLALRC